MNIADLLAHLQEVGSTLNSKGYFGQLKAMGANAQQNVATNFPAIAKDKPTIEDLVTTGLNIGGIGAIKYLYHATPKQNLESIAKIGLKPSKHGYEGPGAYFSKLKTGGEGDDFRLPEYAHFRTDA